MTDKSKSKYPLILSENPPSETGLRREFIARIERGTSILEVEWDPSLFQDLPNINEFNIRLQIQGFKSITDWARRNGFKEHEVKNPLRRWRNRCHGFPNGKHLKVLIELSKTVCYPVTPVLAPFYPDYDGEKWKWKMKRDGGS